ncbi:DeoR/GlpR family transcriptional regulator of sugar metabolism [Haloferula luteola]|uniref:DeoR/GlpR family transcriptional regulator of sugar metabolism n=1 Tax=Haloferula luteola TaxID=595692 RepID=A0A840UVS8_9BACT|nr:DeoR/GlpR family DNA-binding transcription regulator [Haloferula luteola]MBB5349825.1 DeoR/GlpR family transcriptional regulator of sugar metabolism [Haloferula luteola]
MLPAERHHAILSRAKETGTVRTTELARDFGVAEETIRRDLDLLAKRGLLHRAHGGALDPSAGLPELSQNEREALQFQEKRHLSLLAASLVKAGETLLLDASSTALELAAHLPAGVRVISYSLPVIERLAPRSDLELIQLGGVYEPKGRRFSGILTESAVLSIKVDRFFFSGRGMDLERGVSEPNPDQARLKSLMLRHAAWCCALLDHTKLGLRSDYFFARPEDLDAVVTDPSAKSFFKGKLRALPFQLYL